MPLQNTQNVLFDLDGTLIDSREGIVASLRHAFRALGLPVPAEVDLAAMIGPPLHVALRGLLDTSDSLLIARCVAAYRQHYAKVGVHGHRLYPDIVQTLETLRARGVRLYVATSKPVLFARRILAGLHLDHQFLAIHGSELDGSRADKAELIAHLLTQERLDPQACVMIGDRHFDIVGARANAMRAIGVSWGIGSREELHAAGAYAIVDTPGALPALLRGG